MSFGIYFEFDMYVNSLEKVRRMGIILNKEQKLLVKELKYWFKNKTKPYYYYAGSAGTGKTTVVRAFLEEMHMEMSDYIACAYIGKAVMVLLRKGYSASTLHSLMYNVIMDTIYDIKYTEDGDEIKTKKMMLKFELKEKLSKALKLIIVDECKMVNDKMITELLSFGIPVIFMGDENQLPPVMGSSTILSKPDFVLHELMRQAEDDPIVMIANWILNDQPIRYGTYGDCEVLASIPFDKHILTDYDAVLCGKNKTRETINNRLREEILHMRHDKLYIGEKIICRQNNWNECIQDIYLTNGMVGFVEDIHYHESTNKYMTIDFRPDFLDECYESLRIDKKYFFSNYDQRADYGMSYYNKFEFGYAITTHLAQGSEYPDVLFIDEMMHDKDTTRRLRYTGVTRATRSVKFVTPYGY